MNKTTAQKIMQSKARVAGRTARGMAINRNGAIIRCLVNDETHQETLRNEFVGQRNPKRQKFSDAQKHAHDVNLSCAAYFNQAYPKRKSKSRKN